jgi:glycosyltransferase involved in cell wall biosynthesis
VGFLGRLHPTKGIRVLLDAIIRISRPDLVLRIAGTGTEPYETELRGAARGHPVEFLGHTPAADFLREIDVLVVPSLWHEPMGRVVIEAAMHGVPVVAAQRGGISELFAEGRTGWSFDPDEPVQLEARLRSLTRTELQQAQGACRHSAKMYTPDVVAAKWIQLYKHVLSHGLPVPAVAGAAPNALGVHSLSPTR